MDEYDMAVIPFEEPMAKQEETVCSRVKERKYPRLPLIAKLMQIKQSKRERGRGRATMLKARRHNVEDFRPGSNQGYTEPSRSTPSPDGIQTANLLFDSEFPALSIDDDSSTKRRLHSPSLHQSDDHSSSVPHKPEADPSSYSTAEEDNTSHKESHNNHRVARPKVKAMDKQSFAAHHQNVLQEFSSMYGKTHHRPNRVMTLTRSNLERHSRDMDCENYHRIKGEVESGSDFIKSREQALRDGDKHIPNYIKYQVTLDDIQKFKLHEKEVPSNVKGLLASLLFTDDQGKEAVPQDEPTQTRTNQGDEAEELGPDDLDAVSDAAAGTNDSMLSNLSDTDIPIDDTYQSDPDNDAVIDQSFSENAIADPWSNDRVIPDEWYGDNEDIADPIEPYSNDRLENTIINGPAGDSDDLGTDVDTGLKDRQHGTVIDTSTHNDIKHRDQEKTGVDKDMKDRQLETVIDSVKDIKHRDQESTSTEHIHNELTGAKEILDRSIDIEQAQNKDYALPTQCDITVSAYENHRHLQYYSTEQTMDHYSTEKTMDEKCQGLYALKDGSVDRSQVTVNQINELEKCSVGKDNVGKKLNADSEITIDYHTSDIDMNMNGVIYQKYDNKSAVCQLDDFDSDARKAKSKKRNKNSKDSKSGKSKIGKNTTDKCEESRAIDVSNCDRRVEQKYDESSGNISAMGTEINGDLSAIEQRRDIEIMKMKTEKASQSDLKSNFSKVEKICVKQDDGDKDNDRLSNDSHEEDFQEVKHKHRKRKGSAKSPTLNINKQMLESTTDNTVWRLYGPCVIQVSGIPAGADVSSVMEFVNWFGTVVDQQERHREDGCYLRVKFTEEEACDFAIENLNGSECVYPDAGCSLQCEKLKY